MGDQNLTRRQKGLKRVLALLLGIILFSNARIVWAQSTIHLVQLERSLIQSEILALNENGDSRNPSVQIYEAIAKNGLERIRRSREQLAEEMPESRQNAFENSRAALCDFWLLQEVRYLPSDEASYWRAKALTIMGSALLPRNDTFSNNELYDPEKSVVYLENAWHLLQSIENPAEEHKYQRVWTAGRLAHAYGALERYEDALDYYYKALELQALLPQEQFDSKYYLSLLTSVNNIYVALNADKKARDVIDKAIDFIRESDAFDDIERSVQEATFLLMKSQTYSQSTIKELQAGLQDLQLASNILEEDVTQPLNLALNSRFSRFTSEQLLSLFEGRTMYVATLYSVAILLHDISKIQPDLRLEQQIKTYINKLTYIEYQIGEENTYRNLTDRTSIYQVLGILYHLQGSHQKALDYYIRMAMIAKQSSLLDRYFNGLAFIGHELFDLKQYDEAFNYLTEALVFATEKDVNVTVAIYDTLSKVEQERGHLISALEKSKRAIHLVESLRNNVLVTDERISLFSGFQDIYGQYISLLMVLHQRNLSDEYAKEAFLTSEATRARALIEILSESNITPRQGADLELLRQERNLEERLKNSINGQTEYFCYSLNDNSQWIVEEISSFEREINQLKNELSGVRYQILNSYSASAAISQSDRVRPLAFHEIQQDVLDDDSVLLQYAIGKEQSHLWVVSNHEQQSYLLPPKAEIEQAVEEFRTIILEIPGNPPQDINRFGKALAQKVLPLEAIPALQDKRLVIAADGILQTLPFAALPDLTSTALDSEYVPLIEAHEIVNIPSVTAIATQRQEIIRQQQQGNRNPSKVLAAIANPVFESSSTTRTTESALTTESAIPTILEAISLELEQRAAERSLQNFGQPSQLAPLPNTETVATAILELVSNPNQTTERLRYEANQDWVTQAPLNQYRYLFFGTHGFADNINPELSFIALSLFNEQGQPIDGYLRLNEIFNLKLAADVVVLNACQTGLGSDMRGEGLIGLTRGFMYAGAKTIVASLWDVSATDQTTRLMTSFFAQLLPRDGSQSPTPAAALRSAQLELRKDHPNDPVYWAAFTIQGDWR